MLFIFLGPLVLQDVPRLAIQHVADGLQRRKADRADVTVLQLGQVDIRHTHPFAQLVERHLAVSHHPVKAENDWHNVTSLQRLVGEVLQLLAVLKHVGQQEEHRRDDQHAQVKGRIDIHMGDLVADEQAFQVHHGSNRQQTEGFQRLHHQADDQPQPAQLAQVLADLAVEGLPLLHRREDGADGLHAQMGDEADHRRQDAHQRILEKHAAEIRHIALGDMEGDIAEVEHLINSADHFIGQVEQPRRSNDGHAHQAGNKTDHEKNVNDLENNVDLTGGRSELIHGGCLLCFDGYIIAHQFMLVNYFLMFFVKFYMFNADSSRHRASHHHRTKARKKEALRLPLRGNRQRPILPGRVQPSTFGTGELNYCVRYGNRWDLSVITTGKGGLRPISTFCTFQ